MGGAVYAYGPVGVNLGYGWTSDDGEGPGARLGIHVPVPFVVAAQADFYVQLPRRAVLGLDGGVGVTGVPVMTTVMPYAQLGALDATGSGFYATYGFMFGPDPSDVNYDGPGGGADVPGIAFQRVNGRTTTSAFVMAIIARDRRCPDEFSGCVRQTTGPLPAEWRWSSDIASDAR